MASTRHTFTTEPRGAVCGSSFDGSSNIKNAAAATISRITVFHGQYLNSLTVHYTGETSGTNYGAHGGTTAEVVLEPGEFITTVGGHAEVSGCISQLSFVNNKGRRWGPYGTQTGPVTFAWKGEQSVGGDMASQMGLLYFSGSWGPAAIGQLKATFAEYIRSDNPPTVVMYEEEDIGPQSRVPAGLSKFAQSLMSPVVTLHVGPGGIIFRAYEDTLCRLPFFRAALTGKFIEASEKKITMPEDEPEVLSALIQFLYDGRYTYTHKPVGVTSKVQKNPPIELKEGLFHARVYALANKYDCQGLVDAAKKSLKYVLKGLKGVDIIRLLKETYDKGWAVSEWEEDSDMKGFRQGLPVLLKGLFLSDREEMELIISECPAVGYDLMRLLVST